jgi:hypothetical protein
MGRCIDCGAAAVVYQNGKLLCMPCLNSSDAAMLVMRPEEKEAESEGLSNSKSPRPGTPLSELPGSGAV